MNSAAARQRKMRKLSRHFLARNPQAQPYLKQEMTQRKQNPLSRRCVIGSDVRCFDAASCTCFLQPLESLKDVQVMQTQIQDLLTELRESEDKFYAAQKAIDMHKERLVKWCVCACVCVYEGEEPCVAFSMFDVDWESQV